MTFSYNIDPKTRFIVLYQDAQMKSSRISKVTGIPLRTVQDWILKIENDIDIFAHQPKNFTSKIDEQTTKSILKDLKDPSNQTSTRKLGAKYDVSHTAVRNLLIQKGFQFKPVKNNRFLTADEKQKRVLYCKDMLKYRCKKLKRCFFSDEMGIRLKEVSNLDKAWQGPNGNLKKKRINQDIKLNCWAAISWNGATSLHIFSENLNNTLYQDIVESHAMELEDIYPDKNYYYQHDNLPAHNKLEIFEDDEKIEIIDFPTYSPDLNPIENMWSTLKYRVACDAPTDEEELIESLIDNWEFMTELENLRPYIETLEQRYLECIEKNGNVLPY